MGMGEPLENYEAVAAAIRALTDRERFAMAWKNITVSTVGIVGNMRRLMDDLPQVKMAISLHAPNQELRQQLLPVAKTYKIEELMECVDDYASRNASDGKRKGMVMVSYVLLEGVNDTDECAVQLRDLVKDRPVIMNLIPYNPWDGNEHDYKSPSAERTDAFLHVLEDAGIRVFERRHHGRDIAAACGQLAKINKQPHELTDIESLRREPKLARDILNLKLQSAAKEAGNPQADNPQDPQGPSSTMNVCMGVPGISNWWLATGILVSAIGAAGFLRLRANRL
jgi:sorting nexin-8